MSTIHELNLNDLADYQRLVTEAIHNEHFVYAW